MRCKPGDLCEVIGGAFSLHNLGKIVEVIRWEGDHSKFGIIWHCKSSKPDLITEYGAVGNQADFADDWLRPIPKEKSPAANDERFNYHE
jgi:hypothetical protein